jgi:hypothetical protein
MNGVGKINIMVYNLTNDEIKIIDLKFEIDKNWRNLCQNYLSELEE